MRYIRAIKGYSHSFRIARSMCAMSLLSSREQRYIKAMSRTVKKNNILTFIKPNCITETAPLS